MNTLIVYASLHGCSKKCAYLITNLLEGNTELVNLKKEYNIDFNKYSNIIIGGSIHTGHINPSIKEFCNKYEKQLMLKNLGVYLCFMDPIEKGDYYIFNSFSDKFVDHIKVKGYFGGEFDFDKMTFFEKLFIQKTTKINQSISKIDPKKIQSFCIQMNALICSN
ncbi:flavodoxin domain-containing protein [Bacteroidota bacterium]